MILVTGPDGFIGTRVCRELVARGKKVVGAQWREEPLPEGCRSVIVGKVGHETDWSGALRGVHTVLHLAARVHVMKETTCCPETEFQETNVDGTRQLADSAARSGVKRFVFMSSVKVNGEVTNSIQGPFKESDPSVPEDLYAFSKWKAEEVLREIRHRFDMEVVIVRSPLVYGPGVKANFFNLLRLVDLGVPLPFGSLRNRRSFISLTNLVDVLCSSLHHPAAAGETFLVSDGDDVSTPELVRRIAHSLNKPARLVPVPEWMMKLGGKMVGKTEQIKRLCGSLQVDSSKIRTVLDWSPRCTMVEELAEIAVWYQRQKYWKGGEI